MTFNQWAERWRVPPAALQELRAIMGVAGREKPPPELAGLSEAVIQQQVRIEASARGARLWRNNNGATFDQDGRMIRYGLANDSHALSKRIKSSDLIGVTPYTIQQADVGRQLGVFTSYEIKRAGWHYAGTVREVAQLAWINLVISLGGLAKFVTRRDDLY